MAECEGRDVMTFTYSRRKSHSILTDEEARQPRNDVQEYIDSGDDLAALLRIAMSDIHFSGDTDLPFLYIPQVLKDDSVLLDETALDSIYVKGRGLSGRSHDAYLAQVVSECL